MTALTITVTGADKLAAVAASASREIDGAVAKAIQKVVATGVQTAKAGASFSTRVAASVHLETGQKGAAIVAGGNTGPPAAGFERPGGFSHPVFGRGSVHVEGHPFLKPALDGVSGAIESAVVDAVKGLI
jgi:hypothetical protein